jgi:glycosyltransferase involved in cell wall biosynthesis
MAHDQSSDGLLRRLWHQAPHPVRRFGITGVAFGLNALGRCRGYLERGAGAPDGDLTIMGYHRSILGLGRGARLFQQALAAGGVATSAWDVSQVLRTDLTLPDVAGPNPSSRAVIAHLNPTEHIAALALYRGQRPKPGRRIGYWAWETSKAPDIWREGTAIVDEIWCPSHFTANAISELVGSKRPVHVVPHPLPLVVSEPPDRARFGLAPDKVVFLAACDLNSSIGRKNPLGAIEAFRRAALKDDDSAELIVKIHGAPDHPARALLEATAARVPHVRIMSERLSGADMATLKSSVDVILSPHRAEGFGLVLAEAMMLGKPVIATRWSGNLDFMTEDTSALIDCTEVDVADESGVYSGGKWAQPNLDHTADWIARLAGDADLRAHMGQGAQAHMTRFCDPQEWLARVDALTR